MSSTKIISRAWLIVSMLSWTSITVAQTTAEPTPSAPTAPTAAAPTPDVVTSLPADAAIVPPSPTPSAATERTASMDVADGASVEDTAWPKLQFHGRLMTGFEVDRKHPESGQPTGDDTEQRFFLKQARVGLDAELDKRVSATFSFDIDSAAMRNAYVNVSLKKAFQVRAGHFKRPFSRLSNRSVGSIPFRSRGTFDKLLMEDQFWGDRTLGAMLWGKPNKAFRYYAAVMSPASFGTDVEGADAIGRVEYSIVKPLSLGAGYAHKWTERFGNGPNLSLNAVTGDVKVEIGALYAAVEVTAAQNPNPPAVATDASLREPWALGVQGYATYAFKLASKLSLSPVAVLEWMDTDLDFSHDERLRAVLGCNLGYRDGMIRVMPQVEIKRPVGSANVRGEVASESYYLMLATEI